jgi:hypothetical protein
MHFDALFCKADAADWFPVAAAVEHENDPDGFDREIKKLLTVRAPLKVGITYALRDQGSAQPLICNRVEAAIRDAFNSIKPRLLTRDANDITTQRHPGIATAPIASATDASMDDAELAAESQAKEFTGQSAGYWLRDFDSVRICRFRAANGLGHHV